MVDYPFHKVNQLKTIENTAPFPSPFPLKVTEYSKL
jgi:hypothetical protein